ncbi:DUF397 domain-containing protein [Thermomonospora amylolytica]|uniref:DUF397 domain-containing protein n=1 Tax=Thermomonospora amylolytica TaxID=1411117 RepID=UPI000E6BF05A|nr:DUF397 domain-containing protein [Thermomonospora amylolytica]
MTHPYSRWRKSSYSEPDGHCVEAGKASDGGIGVRDTKGDPAVILEVAPREWARLLARVRERGF